MGTEITYMDQAHSPINIINTTTDVIYFKSQYVV